MGGNVSYYVLFLCIIDCVFVMRFILDVKWPFSFNLDVFVTLLFWDIL